MHVQAQDYPEMVTVPVEQKESKGFNPFKKIFDKNKNIAEDVTLPPFQISKTEITVGQYKLFCRETNTEMPKQPVYADSDDYAVSNISVYDALAYINWLSEKKGKTYRLPNYEEWFFAFSGGISGKDYDFSGAKNLDDVAWYRDNSKGQIHPVAAKQENELGLFDMSGNVAEVCVLSGSDMGFKFVISGGHFGSSDLDCRGIDPVMIQMGDIQKEVGFRVVSSN